MFYELNKIRVPALARAYRLMAALVGSPWPLGVSELARDLDLSKSTVHGLVHALIELGFLERDGQDERKVKPAAAVISLWREALLKGSLRRAAGPLLAAFSDRQSLTALAGVFLPGRVLIIEAVLAPGISVAAYPGQLVPAWAGALGKLLLSTRPPRRAKALAGRMAARGPLDEKTYLAEVDQVRVTGVALDREEYIEGVRALAAAVVPAGPLDPLGAVWTVGLAPSLGDARMEALVPELRSLAEEVGWRMAEIEAEGRDA
ncbi:MAG: helix-turn-helix domain-containing protein [Thermodesulfobacteriota bacterium]